MLLWFEKGRGERYCLQRYHATGLRGDMRSITECRK